MSPTRTPDLLSLEVAQSLLLLSNAQRRQIAPVLASHDLQPGQAFCLRLLTREGAHCQHEIADALGLSRATVTRLVQRLEERGLVVRQPDPEDQRQVLVAVTAAGRATAEEVAAAVQAQVADSVAHLPEDDRRTLARILQDWAALTDKEPKP